MTSPVAPSDPPRRVHPLVRLDYPLRIIGHLLFVIILASIFSQRGVSPALWAVLPAVGLGWPHLAYLRARRSADSKRAEFTNLLVDAFLTGCWTALAAFSPWPAATFIASLYIAILSVGGIRLSLLALGPFLAGAALTAAVTGFRFEPAASPLTVGLCFAGMLTYASVFGLTSNRQARHYAHLLEQTRDQRARLERLSANLEQLYRLSTAMQEPLSLREQLHRVLEAASRMGILDRLYVWAVSPEADRLVNLAGAGFSAEELLGLEGTEIPLHEAGAMYKAYCEGVPLVFDEGNPLPPELRLGPPYSQIRAIRSRSLLAIPMIARGLTLGVLTGDNKPSGRPILPQTVELLQTFASHAAVAIAHARLFQAVEDKSRQLAEASRAKSQFLANVSHELRTPLNAILGYTELILDNTYGEVPEKLREVMERVDRSGRHLLGLINDVLDLSRIEAGQLALALSDYSMKEVIQTVFLAAEALAAEKKLDLAFSIPPDLPLGRGDERRLTQVLLNLVGNAIKFTEAGQVAVRVTAEDEAFVVSVADTGPGIAPEDQQRIFEEFQQVDASSTRRKGGTGLGLAIARRIVELHGGSLWVTSVPGRGSTFSFRIPVRVERRKRAVPVGVERREATP